MSPAVRKFALAAHVLSSVAWLGAVLAFFVLNLAGLKSHDADTVRAVYIAMNLIGEYVLVPLSLAALTTGIIQSLGTEWGLFRYYWVATKLMLTIGATMLLVMHQFTSIAEAARHIIASPPGTFPDASQWAPALLNESIAAILLLGGMTILSIYKPWGSTSHGRRTLLAGNAVSGNVPASEPLPLGLKIVLVVVALAVVALLILHHGGGGAMHHSF